MKLIEIKSDINWGLWFRGKPLMVNKKYYTMKAEHIAFDETIPLDVELVEMDENYVSLCDGMGDYKVKRFYQAERMNGFRGIVALLDGKIIGFLCGAKEDLSKWKYEITRDYFYIKYVFVDPSFRGKHLSRLFLKVLNNRLGERDLYLMVRKNNTSAISAYEKVGFRKVYYIRQIVFPLIQKNRVYYHKYIR